MKVLVTGATGFVGNSLISRLLRNEYSVSIIVRKTSNTENIPDNVKIYIYEDSIESMNYILKDSKPDIVIHLASLYISQHRPEDVVHLIRSNVEFGSNLLEAMSINGIKNFINTGTSWQHYNNENYNPANLYAATKQAFESVLKFYVEAKSFNAINLHLFDSYGSEDKRVKLLSLLKKAVLNGIEIDMTPGEQEILLVNVEDLVEGYISAIEYIFNRKKIDLETFSIGNHDEVNNLIDLVKRIEKITGKKIKINFGKKDYREREVFKVWSTDNPLPNWKQKVLLDIGLKEYFDTNNEIDF